MKKTYKYSNALIFSAALLMTTAMTGCSDWDDHYDANSSESSTSGATLWENITSNGKLTQFADLVKKAGYSDELNTTQVYTVWAPLDGTFDYSTLAASDSATILREFVKNHVTRYNYPATGSLDVNIFMLNNKVEAFAGQSSYTFGGISVETPNIASSNGVLHTINGKVDFFSNIYEYLNKRDYAIDSLGNYYHKFDIKTLDTENSVPGPTVNGEITYLDSVFIENNALYTRIGRAYINREDSNYSMILPTNDAWAKTYKRMKNDFNYVPSFKFSDISSGVAVPTNVNVSNTYLQDSVIHYNLIKDLVFNNNLYANGALANKTSTSSLTADSLMTTYGDKIYKEDANDLFTDAHKITMSNGYGWVVDSLRMKPWNSWNPIIKVEAENSIYRVYTSNASSHVMTATTSTKNKEVQGSVSSNRYIDVEPSSTLNPEVSFYLPEILSTSYDIYCVFVPANITNTKPETLLPNKARFTLGYNSETGAAKTQNLGTYSSTLGRVDTVFIGTFKFPMAYKGTGQYYPYLKVRSSVASGETTNYSREMLIDCLILVPTELNNYIKEHPGYKYDARNNN